MLTVKTLTVDRLKALRAEADYEGNHRLVSLCDSARQYVEHHDVSGLEAAKEVVQILITGCPMFVPGDPNLNHEKICARCGVRRDWHASRQAT